MIYVLFDIITYSLTGYFISTYLIMLHYLNVNSFIKSIILFYILNDNIFLTISIIIIYLIDHIISKYLDYNCKIAVGLFTFYYLIIHNKIDISYIINLLLVIIIKRIKYNGNGEELDEKVYI